MVIRPVSELIVELVHAVDGIGITGVLLILDVWICTAVNSIEPWGTGQKHPL